MKLLVLAFDGIDAPVLARGWTPRLAALSEEGDHLSIHEDLLSRGWSEIMTGRHAMETGALYERPVMNGRPDWTEKFKLGDIPGLGDRIRPFWQLANERGLSVGVMNVPTTFPAPEVDGFFVSGGGGGGPSDPNVKPSQCYPSSLAERLREDGYIVDLRFGELFGVDRLFEPEEAFGRLAEMVQRRIRAFGDLAVENDISIGFLAFKSTVVAETMALHEVIREAKGHPLSNSGVTAGAALYYRALDEELDALVDRLKPERILLVSDHATVLAHTAVNPNAFLVKSGYQVPSRTGRTAASLVQKVKHFVPHKLKKRLKSNDRFRRGYESIAQFDPAGTRAFCMTISNGAHGIYINDADRFGGPVAPEDVTALSVEIARAIEDDPLSREHGFKARPKRSDVGTQQAQQFPDIVLDLPDGYHTTTRVDNFVVPRSLPERKLSLEEVARDARFSVKGHSALAVSYPEPWSTSSREPGDLTGVYREIQRIIES